MCVGILETTTHICVIGMDVYSSMIVQPAGIP